jgi:hypothetical protein
VSATALTWLAVAAGVVGALVVLLFLFGPRD